MTRYLFAIVLATTTSSTLGFVSPSISTTTCNKHTSTSTELDLTTSESHKLVAFSQHYLSNKAKGGKGSSNLTSSRRRTRSSNDANTHSPRSGVVTAARNVISRLVGHEDKQVSRNKDTSLQSASSTSIEEVVNNFLHEDEGVVYPITGFTLVDGHAVPTPEQQAACNLYNDLPTEEVFGTWTSPQGGDALWL